MRIREALLLSLGLVLCTLAVYAQVLGFGFVQYDDQAYVTENPRVLSGLSREGLAWAMTTFAAENWHPLTWLSLMLDVEIGGASPQVFHLTNLLLHISNTLLLFFVLAALTGAAARSAFVAAVFAVHPLHVESVAWIAERKDVLSALFWILAMGAYARYARRPSPAAYLLVFLATAAGLMSKPMVVSLPLVLLLLDFWPLGRLAGPGPKTRLVGEKLPLLALSVTSSLVTLHAQSEGGAVGTLEMFPLPARIANAVVSSTTYLLKMVWPADLAIPYPWDASRLTAPRVALSALVLGAVFAIASRAWRSRPYLLFGSLWYLVTLLPVIGLVQVGGASMADRYTYLPLVGPMVIVAWGVPDLLARLGWSERRTGLALGLAALVAIATLGVCARAQAALWRDSVTLFTHTLRVTERNAAAHNGLGLTLLERGRVDEAVLHYREVLEIAPAYLVARYNLAAALIQLGRGNEAVPLCEQALLQKPGDARAYSCLGAARMEQDDLEGASDALEEAVRLDPRNAPARSNLGIVRSRQGRNEEAIVHLSEAARLRPRDAGVRVTLGTLLLKGGGLEEAANLLEEALRIDSTVARAHGSLGVARVRQGRVAEGIALFNEALRRDPTDEGARRNLERAKALASGQN